MSILIKGMDMPKEGEHIVTLIKSNGKCTYWKQDTEYGICEPMQTVEAIQIPTPHGRLIDESTMLKQIEKRLDETLSEEHKKRIGLDIFINELVRHTMIDGEIKTLKEWFKRQPTILEAEE